MKNLTLKTLVASMAILALGVAVHSQEPPAPPEGGPGMQQGRPMMGMRGPGGGGLGIVMRAEVQKELKLSEDQVSKLKKLLGQRGQRPGGRGGDGGQGGPPPMDGGQGGPPPMDGGQGGPPPMNGGQGGRPPMGGGQGGPGGRADQAKLEKDIKAILTETQFARLKEIALQQEGPMALAKEDVAAKIGLSDEQKEKIQDILESGRESMPRPEPGERPDFQAMESARKKIGDEVLAVLTTDQKAKWKAMLGKEFKLARPTGGPGGGGPGGGGPG